MLGDGGRGTASYYGLEDEVDIYMGTFSKSLASLGGYMAASSRVADFVRHTSRPFIFSASIPPANCAAAPHECLLRTSLMATHTHALIDEAVEIIAEVLGRYEL